MLKIPPPLDPEPAIIDTLRQALISEFKAGDDRRMVALGLMAMLTAFAPVAAILGVEETASLVAMIVRGLESKSSPVPFSAENRTLN